MWSETSRASTVSVFWRLGGTPVKWNCKYRQLYLTVVWHDWISPTNFSVTFLYKINFVCDGIQNILFFTTVVCQFRNTFRLGFEFIQAFRWAFYNDMWSLEFSKNVNCVFSGLWCDSLVDGCQYFGGIYCLRFRGLNFILTMGISICSSNVRNHLQDCKAFMEKSSFMEPSSRVSATNSLNSFRYEMWAHGQAWPYYYTFIYAFVNCTKNRDY